MVKTREGAPVRGNFWDPATAKISTASRREARFFDSEHPVEAKRLFFRSASLFFVGAHGASTERLILSPPVFNRNQHTFQPTLATVALASTRSLVLSYSLSLSVSLLREKRERLSFSFDLSHSLSSSLRLSHSLSLSFVLPLSLSYSLSVFVIFSHSHSI